MFTERYRSESPSDGDPRTTSLRANRRGQTMTEAVILASVLVGTLIAVGLPLTAAFRQGVGNVERALVGADAVANGAGPQAAAAEPPPIGRAGTEATLSLGDLLARRLKDLDAKNPLEGLNASTIALELGHPTMSADVLDDAVSRQGDALFAAWPALLDRVRNGTTAEKLEGMQLISRALNTTYLRGQASAGNCLYASLALVESVNAGTLVIPRSYAKNGENGLERSKSYDGVMGQLKSGEHWTGKDPRAAEAAALRRLGEGEMAVVTVENNGTGHAATIVKLDGKLHVIENQSSAAQEALSRRAPRSLSEWDAAFRENSGGDVDTKLAIYYRGAPAPPPKRWYEVWK
jgi:hypothetical protein